MIQLGHHLEFRVRFGVGDKIRLALGQNLAGPFHARGAMLGRIAGAKASFAQQRSQLVVLGEAGRALQNVIVGKKGELVQLSVSVFAATARRSLDAAAWTGRRPTSAAAAILVARMPATVAFLVVMACVALVAAFIMPAAAAAVVARHGYGTRGRLGAPTSTTSAAAAFVVACHLVVCCWFV